MPRYFKKIQFHPGELEEMVNKVIYFCEVEGYSIGLARIKALGRNCNSDILAAVMTHPDYMKALNRYMEKIGHQTRYKVFNKMIIPINRKDYEVQKCL